MTFKLKDIIFDFFGVRDRVNDINKDSDNKGLNQRFNELLAGDLDDNEISLTNNLVENTRDCEINFEKYLPYLEFELGIPIFSNDIETRRKFIKHITYLNNRKGTDLGYILMFQLLGFTSANINYAPPYYGFDSQGTFDDIGRVFDQKCKGCSKYSIELFGTLPITPELIASVFSVIEYNEPINAKLESISYNGSPLVNLYQISITVDANGDLIFINPFDASFIAWIDNNGDLLFNSNFSNFYSIDANGDLIFTT